LSPARIQPTATEREITKAYKKTALKEHPDRNPDKPDAKEIFQALVCG
jgi:curved DNA-binding protein CbpA